MRIAGGFSVIAGISYIIASTAHQPRLMVLVIYTATGGVEFVVQAWLLARRGRRLSTPAAPVLSAS